MDENSVKDLILSAGWKDFDVKRGEGGVHVRAVRWDDQIIRSSWMGSHDDIGFKTFLTFCLSKPKN